MWEDQTFLSLIRAFLGHKMPQIEINGILYTAIEGLLSYLTEFRDLYYRRKQKTIK